MMKARWSVRYNTHRAFFRATDWRNGISDCHERGEFYELPLLEDSLRFTSRSVSTGKGEAVPLVVDAGANIGNHSIFWALHKASVVAFEPDPYIFSILASNVRTNNLQQYIQLLQIALADCTCAIHQIPGTTEGTRCYEKGPSEYRREGPQAQAVPLDVFKLEPTIIKIDVDGMDLSALLGATNTIKQFHPIVYVEACTHDAFDAVNSAFMSFDPAYKMVEAFGKTYKWVATDG